MGKPLSSGTPPDQSPTVALLGASGDRLSTLLKEPFAQAGCQLWPEGDELLKIGIDRTVFCVNCAGFCASLLVNCACPEVMDPPPENPQDDPPTEAWAGRQRRQHHNRRREQDPFGEDQPCTWRTRLIKVAAQVTQSTRRVVVRLFSSWPYLKYFQRVGQQILQLAGSTSFDTS